MGDRPKPKKATQVFAGSADILEDPEAKGVFMAATKTNLATVLRVASHRIEIKDISAATRRSKGIKVEYLIHPDDTGIDKTTVSDLQKRAESEAVRSAVVAGQAAYATSAQTSNRNVMKISTDASYSDVELAKKKQKEVEAQNSVLIIVVAVLGGVLGCCLCGLGGFFGIKFMRGSKPEAHHANERQSRYAPSAQATSGGNGMLYPPAPGLADSTRLQNMEAGRAPPAGVPSHTSDVIKASKFCPSCGTCNENARFCAKCGHPIEMASKSDAI